MIASVSSDQAIVRPDALASLFASPQACGCAASDSGCSTIAAKDHATKITNASTKSKYKLGVQTRISKPPAKSMLSTSHYRGVTRHSTTGRYEAHLWDSTFVRAKASKGGRTRGKQVYLGGFKCEVQAARAYDVACLKYWGANTDTNFLQETYTQDIADNKLLSRQEVVAKLKRSSNGFARGQSKYRGVTRHHKEGKWEARIGHVKGSKYLYLGTYPSQEEAARAYDEAALKYRGEKAVTNFNLGGSEDETSSSAGNSSTSLAAHSSASHQHQASATVADSSVSAQSMVALSDFTANSPAMQARLQKHNAFQGHSGATAPDLFSRPATNPPKAQQCQVQLNRQPYQQAEMVFGTSTALSACYESAECDWGYAFRQPCSHAAEVPPCDDFVTSIALLMGKGELSDFHYGDMDNVMFAPTEWDPWSDTCHTFMAATM